MKEIVFSQVGFWSVFTLLFIFVFMGFFIYKMVKLSGEEKHSEHHSAG